MSQRHRPIALRSTMARMAIAGAATLATVAATAPAAVAEEVPTTEGPATQTPTAEDTGSTEGSPDATDAPPAADDSTDEPTAPAPAAPSPATTAPSSAAPSVASSEVAKDEVEPNYGFQKFRVGVQLADGAYAPDASTVGSELSIVIYDDNGDVDDEFTCTTDASTVESGSTASFCLGEDGDIPASVSVEAEDIPEDQAFTAPPGYSVEVTQTTAGDGLVVAPETGTLEPCIATEFVFCNTESGSEEEDPFTLKTSTILFGDFGPPPVAKNDKVTATAGKPVVIKILTNDDDGNGAPITGVELTGDASHGATVLKTSSSGATASSVSAAAASAAAAPGVTTITYTPDDDFTGTDTFSYALTTANGTDSATVTIDVVAATSTAGASTDGVLPDTGAPNNALLGYGALLLAGGGWLVARGRRRTESDVLVS